MMMCRFRTSLAAWIAGAGVIAGCSPSGDRGGDSVAPRQSPDVESPASAPSVATPPKPSPIRFENASSGLPEFGQWKSDPVFVDFDGDGRMDLISLPRLEYGTRAFRGDGKGTWTDASNGLRLRSGRSCGGGVDTGDLNGNGLIDIAAADHCQGIYVYFGDGKGNWEMVVDGMFPAEIIDSDSDDVNVAMMRGMEDLALGDVDGDGDLDILSGGSDEGGLHIFLNDGSGRNWTRQENELINRGWAIRVRLIDVNGDGHPDIVATHSDGPLVYLNDGSGQWYWSASGLPTPMMQGIFHGLGVDDLNNNGSMDLAVANWVNGPEVFFQREFVTWEKAPDVFPDMTGGAVGLALADVDADGSIDIAVSGRLRHNAFGLTRGLFLLLNDGTGRWTWQRGTGLPETGLAQVAGIAFGDMTGDGVPDLAVGGGLTVETGSDGPALPVVSQHLQVWRGIRVADQKEEVSEE